MSDNEELIKAAVDWNERTLRLYPEKAARYVKALAAALEEVSAERTVVEAQALEQAAEKYRDQWVGLAGGVPEWLRARAVEIREGRQ